MYSTPSKLSSRNGNTIVVDNSNPSLPQQQHATQTMTSDNSSYRSEVYIPINKDSRSFEEQEKEAMRRMEQNLRDRENSFTNSVRRTSDFMASHRESFPSLDLDDHGSSLFGDSDKWFEEMGERMENRRRHWRESMEEMRRDMFRLQPMFSDSSRITGFPYKDSNWSMMPVDSQDQSVYETGEDGNVYYKVRFDVNDFLPENIRVSTKDRKLTVSARQETKTSNSVNMREFTRSVDLPSSVGVSDVSCMLSVDGVLTLSAPVNVPNYETASQQSISSFSRRSGKSSLFSDSPTFLDSSSSIQQQQQQQQEQQHQQSNYSSIINVNGELRVKLQLGPDYQPEDISIQTLDDRVIVHAKHLERTGNRTCTKEFKREFQIPQTVDPQKIKAHLEDGVLTLTSQGNSQ